MYRDDLEAMQARLRTLSAEIEAERRARRAAEAAAQAAKARADEAMLEARRRAEPPSPSLLRRHWLAVALLAVAIPAWWLCSDLLRASYRLKLERQNAALQAARSQSAELRREVGALKSPKAVVRPRPLTVQHLGSPFDGPRSTLSRSDIQQGLRAIKPAVQACYDRFKVPGMANVQVKIAGGGGVSSARVVGMFTNTPTGDCVAQAARAARFPVFQGSSITITYPFILR